MTSDHFLHFLNGWQNVLWPQFAEHDGCVFSHELCESDKQTFRDWMEQTAGDRRAVEAVMNHLHIVDILEHTLDSPSREAVLTFGRLIRDLWTAKLARDFPDRHFIVTFPEDHCNDLVDYEITFFQEPRRDPVEKELH